MIYKGIIVENIRAAKALQLKITQRIIGDHGHKYPKVKTTRHFCDYIVGKDGRCFFVLPPNRHRGHYSKAFNEGDLNAKVRSTDRNFFPEFTGNKPVIPEVSVIEVPGKLKRKKKQ